MPPLPVYSLPGALDAVLSLDRPEVLDGSYELHQLEPGDELTIGPFDVRTALLPHPRPNVGVRISIGARSMVYTGDCGPSEELVNLANETDLLLAEASYAEAVHADLVGMLSSATDVGREAAMARVGRLVLTHLIPTTSDSDAIDAATRQFEGPIAVARPGLVVDV
jgi:ribonuclease BN (tRNA processing enzyme)